MNNRKSVSNRPFFFGIQIETDGPYYLFAYESGVGFEVYEINTNAGGLQELKPVGEPGFAEKLFYEHVSIRDLFTTPRYGFDMVGWELQRILKNKCRESPASVKGGIKSLSDVELLQLVRDFPSILNRDKTVAMIFAGIIAKAKHGRGDDAKRYREMIKDNLNPTSPGGLKRVPPDIKSRRDTLRLLSPHLSGKCRKFYMNETRNHVADNWFSSEIYDRPLYIVLIEVVNDKRLVEVKPEGLLVMYLAPHKFADTMLAENYGVSYSYIKNLK